MIYVGIDIGATKTAISLAGKDKKLFCNETIKTARCADFSENASDIFARIDTMLAQNELAREDIAAIGLCCPGPNDLEQGTIVYVGSIGWRDVPVRSMFEREFGCPVAFANDAAGAAFAEAMVGAGKGKDIVLYFTVSTGVGGGIVIGGDIYSGARGYAAEFGHITVDPKGEPCRCGGRGCVQNYSSGTAIAAIAKRRVESGEASSLAGKPEITALDVELAARAGDALALDVWNTAMEKLGVLVGVLFQAFDPDVMVFGGGVSNAWDIMERPIRESAERYIYETTREGLVLKQSALGSLVGVTGAVLLAAQLIGE